MSVPLGGAAWLKNGSCGALHLLSPVPRSSFLPASKSIGSGGGGGVSTVGGAGGGTYVDSTLAVVFDKDVLSNDALELELATG